MRTSFRAMGKVIQDFCNDTADFKWEMLKCPKVHGHKREKPTLAMPAEMLGELSEFVADRTLMFGQNAEKVRTPDEAL